VAGSSQLLGLQFDRMVPVLPRLPSPGRQQIMPSLLRILVAASSPVFGRSLVRAVGEGNHQVVPANTEEEILSHLSQDTVDLCFFQDVLGECSGIDLCQRVVRDEEITQIPIILFSRDPGVETASLEKGASDFLKVPSRPAEVLALVDRWGDMARRPDTEIGDDAPEPITNSIDTVLHSNPSERDNPLVLLVDDSQVIHKYVQNSLQDTRFDLMGAFDGVEGLAKARETHPDLIISDIDMPNMNGFEMCKCIKELKELEDIPILILSARGAGVDVDQGFDVGANDFLTKPVDANELITRIELILGTGKGEEHKREKILVVEDSSLQRNVIIQGLSQQGFEVIPAADGQEGLAQAMKHVPDLVITDSEMPIMNGRDLTRELKKRENLKEIPVLMLTAADSTTERAKGEHAGVSAYLTKPFVPDKVVVIAEKLISERRMVRERQAMSHYLSDSTRNVDDIMRAEQAFVTVFFTDIVGFTPLTERLEPEELVSLLNHYFDHMAPLFKDNDGIIDKYVGDAIMALFVGEDAQSHSSAAYNAVKTGLEMLEALKLVNEGRSESINIRVGINSGKVIMGDIGSKLYRRDHTVIGDNVNIAARLEAAAEHGSVLISESTYQLISDRLDAEMLGPIQVKGKSEPITVYQVNELL
jgi:DNA-binding response OmpR family regulator